MSWYDPSNSLKNLNNAVDFPRQIVEFVQRGVKIAHRPATLCNGAADLHDFDAGRFSGVRSHSRQPRRERLPRSRQRNGKAADTAIAGVFDIHLNRRGYSGALALISLA